MNKLIADKNDVLTDCKLIMRQLTNCSETDAKLEKVQEERSVLEELLRRLIEQNAREPIYQEAYNSRYESLDERYRQCIDHSEQLTAEK